MTRTTLQIAIFERVKDQDRMCSTSLSLDYVMKKMVAGSEGVRATFKIKRQKEQSPTSLFLTTVFPKHNKTRIELAFVLPMHDGTYKEQSSKKEIVPPHRWISIFLPRQYRDAKSSERRNYMITIWNTSYLHQPYQRC